MRPYYRFCRFVCQALYLLLMRGRVFGTSRVPRTGGVLLAANHQSFFDPVLATLALPRECDYMARDTLFAHRAFRRLIESLNAFPVRRGEADIAAVKETLRRLKNGRLITVFPEATRTPDGRIAPMQPGLAAIARKANVPVVPVLIEGAFEAWPRHRKFPRLGTVTVVYGEPIPPEQARAMHPQALVDEIARRLRAMQAIERGRRGLAPLEYHEAGAVEVRPSA